jgi:hypothetical protein
MGSTASPRELRARAPASCGRAPYSAGTDPSRHRQRGHWLRGRAGRCHGAGQDGRAWPPTQRSAAVALQHNVPLSDRVAHDLEHGRMRADVQRVAALLCAAGERQPAAAGGRPGERAGRRARAAAWSAARLASSSSSCPTPRPLPLRLRPARTWADERRDRARPPTLSGELIARVAAPWSACPVGQTPGLGRDSVRVSEGDSQRPGRQRVTRGCGHHGRTVCISA